MGSRLPNELLPAAYTGAVDDERVRLAAIIEGTGAGTWGWNVQTGETRFNERWAQIVGMSLDELAPTTIDTWTKLAHPDDLTRSATLLMAHFEGETDAYVCEARMRHRDGHWVWVQDRGRLLTRTPDGRPEWMFGTHLDVSERKAQEDRLRRSEELLNRTGELARVGGWEVDLRTGRALWSQQTCRIHGVAPGEEPELDDAINFYAPEARPLIAAAVERAKQTGTGWDLEVPFIQKGGQRIWVRAAGNAEWAEGHVVRLFGSFQDITDQVAQRQTLEAAQQRAALAHQQLSEQHELLRVTLNSIADAVITTDAAGMVTWLNPAAERLTGWLSAQATGQALNDVFRILNAETRKPIEDPLARCFGPGAESAQATQTVLLSRDGVQFGIQESASPIRSTQADASGEVLGAVIVFRDITEQRRLTTEMSYRATHDALTGLINRTEFEAQLERLLAKSREDDSEHAVLYIDLDQFKLVNDACGHAAGDLLLQQVGRLLAKSVRSRDTLARLGGDEFAAILEHCTAEQAQRAGQQICDHLEEFRFLHDGRRFSIRASIGLVPFDKRWPSTMASMQAADAACYAAKEAGRNRVHIWCDTDKAVRERHGEMQWATRLEQALDENHFELHAQRIVPLAGSPTSLYAELLIRLREVDAQGNAKLIAPGAFLPAAERYNLAPRIDSWVLEQAVRRLEALPDLSMLETLCINLSGQSIGDRAFHRVAIQTLAAAGSDICERLCLEITETAAITNMADATLFIDQMRTLGVRFALDDFGAGASSFSYLKRLKVDIIKIDGSFVRDLVEDRLNDATVRCFVEVARVVGVKTVAEFVDKPEVLQRIREIGVDYAQGYLLHKPEPFENLLQNSTSRLLD